VTPIQGELSVRCESGRQSDWATFDCRSDILEPADHDYFVTDSGILADHVDLHAVHEDGSTRDKDEDFDSEKGQSKDTFNLWIGSLFQRPLLNGGVNRIGYQLKKDGNVVKTGDFVVNVKSGAARTCQRDYVTSHSMSDCHNGGVVCDQYFRRQDFCR
jgi:hypothetical protein